MILNAEELVSLTHLPDSSVRAHRLVRKVKRTKAPPPHPQSGGIVLGENTHEGMTSPVVIGTEQRLRHLHILGNSGTGKSTLLLNLICQDIYQNNGVAVLDPHGDLIDDILPFIPQERWNDVILFDASDDEYPIGFNILSTHSELEKTLLASDLVEVFRRLSTSWGHQMRSVLGNAILAFLENSTTGTLPELRRFLIEPAFRNERLSTVTDPEVKYYWEHEFPILKTQSLGPLLTRLDEFLRRKTIRYIVGQKENRLDFGAIMDAGQIFLARLPQGLIGEENSHMLGSLLVSKFHQLAIARQQRDKADRRPFSLYLDEAHHFVTPTLETILSGGRKYGLGLTLAHQGVHQLDGAGNVGQSVLSLTGSRVCFRVGDADARQLAEGFSYFERTDLQSLENYEAIARFDRREHDFNLMTITPPELDEQAEWRRAYLRYISRLRYGTPRQDVEAELAAARVMPEKSPVDPFAKRTRDSNVRESHQQPFTEPASSDEQAPVPSKPLTVPAPSPPAPKTTFQAQSPITSRFGSNSTQTHKTKIGVDQLHTSLNPASVLPNAFRSGKGGPEHQYAQHFIKNLALAMQFRVELEFQIEGTRERVDVMIQKGPKRMALEISISTPTEYEARNITKCLDADFDRVLFVSEPKKHFAVRREIALILSPQQLSRVQFSQLKDVSDRLLEFEASCGERQDILRGRRTKVQYHAVSEIEAARRKKAINEISTRSIRRIREPSHTPNR